MDDLRAQLLDSDENMDPVSLRVGLSEGSQSFGRLVSLLR